VEGHSAALRMTRHSYRTFSHHNSFWPIDTEGNCPQPKGKPQPQNKSLNTWYHTALDASFIREQKLPMTDAYGNESLHRNGQRAFPDTAPCKIRHTYIYMQCAFSQGGVSGNAHDRHSV
jgi:hypothetical protein